MTKILNAYLKPKLMWLVFFQHDVDVTPGPSNSARLFSDDTMGNSSVPPRPSSSSSKSSEPHKRIQCEGTLVAKKKMRSSEEAIRKAAQAVEASVRPQDEDDAFGSLVSQLMKGVPKEKKSDLRIKLLTLIKEASD